MKAHPCHSCPEREQHARWAERWWRLKRETDALSQQIKSRTGAVAKIFDRVTDVLLGYGYLVPDDSGRPSRSARAAASCAASTAERDLLVAESLRRASGTSSTPAGLAAMACALVFEPRRDEGLIHDRYLPQGLLPARPRPDPRRCGAELDDLERDNKLPGSNPLAPGLSLAMWKWARGGSLDDVLAEADMAAGDFVRWTKQTIDLLDQLSVVADGSVGRTARQAMDAVRRGIVAYSPSLRLVT